jgi:hypothetical protein
MRSRIFNPDIWGNFNYRDPEHKRFLLGAMQHFCALPNKDIPPQFAKIQEFVKAHGEIQRAAFQAFTLPSDFPEKPTQVIEKYHALIDYDQGYEQIFNIRDMTGTTESGFDVLDVESGLTFRSVKPGEKVKVYQMSGDKYRCFFNYYGGALGWHRQLFDDREYWTIEDNAIEFRNKAYSYRAEVFYTLLQAAASLKGCCAYIPADCDDCDAEARAIATNLNFAATTILDNCKDKGYGLNPATTGFIVLTPLNLRGKVRYALGQRMQAFADSERLIDYNFTQVTTMMGGLDNHIMVILPKRKILGAYRMDLTLFDDFDILSYTDTVAGWMRYGGCIGDLDQIECIEFPVDSGSCPPSPDYKIGKVVKDVCEAEPLGPVVEGEDQFEGGEWGHR